MMVGRAVGFAPWVIASITLVSFVVLIGPTGLIYTVGWGLFLVFARSFANGPRGRRLSVDAVLAVVAFFGAYVGGWYLIPAILVFVLLDAADHPTPRPQVRWLRDAVTLTAIGSVGAGLIAVLYLALGATYSTTSSSVGQGGSVSIGPKAALTFLEANGVRGMVVLASVVVLLTLSTILAGSWLERSRRSYVGRVLLGIGAVGLGVLTIVTAPTIGRFLAPAALLAVLALASAIWSPRPT